MRKIYKTISLEPMTSRLPSVVPAYVPGTNTPITFDDTALRNRGYAYTSNWGLVPCNVGLPIDIEIPCLNDKKCLVCSDISGLTYIATVGRNGDCNTMCQCRVISFERLSNWYYKFKEYYNLLNHYGHCNTVYANAHSYYKNEVKRWPEDLYYGNNEQTYIDLDAEIRCMGGIPTAIPKDDTSCSTPGFKETVDSGFYEWICDYVVPTYKIPRDLQDYWQRDTLYYPDVIKWIGWFDDRYAKYGASPNCETSSDCCDCTEYVNRGGYSMVDENNQESLTTWYSGVTQNINTLNSIIIDSNTKKPKPCFVPHIISPIELQNSIEDLGEFSIFCERYEIGTDYRTIPTESAETETIIHFESGNTHSGATVIKDDKVQRLISGSGYVFDEVFMEKIDDEDGWIEVNLPSETDGVVSGYTTSKFNIIHLDNYLTDDIGNMIDGLYDISGKTNHQPNEGEVLEPLYQVSAITNVMSIDGHDDMFKGDVIDTMDFYYKLTDSDSGTSKHRASAYTVVSAITEAEAEKEDDLIYDDDVYCDVTYHIGNMYQLSGNTPILSGEGIEYSETVQFVKTRVEYYLKQLDKNAVPTDKSTPSAHSVSYPIYVYRLKQNEETIRDNTYDTPYTDSLSYFEIPISTMNRVYDSEYTISGDTKVPLMREEYRLGIAAQESVKGDIYIDRGINSAFEKHLKLGEVTSLEALENYGNGYFKIMDK